MIIQKSYAIFDVHPTGESLHSLPLPLILLGSEYWQDLYVSIKNTMIKNDTIVSSDLDLLYMTDDPDEVVDIINKHREWKKLKIAESKDKE